MSEKTMVCIADCKRCDEFVVQRRPKSKSDKSLTCPKCIFAVVPMEPLRQAVVTLRQRVEALETAATKRHECPNCRPCPCTETD